MTKVINSILLSGAILQAQGDVQPLDCKLHIALAQTDPTEIILTLSYDDKCKVIMDQGSGQIKLISKNMSDQDSNTDQSSENNSTLPTSSADKLITLAKSKLGNSYAPTKAGPDHFDCSGFVYYLFKSNDIAIPRSSLEQSKAGKYLKREEIKRGDILFFDTANRHHVNHSGVYLGEGKFIHSSSGKAYAVTISELDKGFYKDKFLWGIRKLDE
ncbi:MAG: C40 family peptidase [Campylobacterota bacterium]|nr:C40 family peptidase [Campylobacterota bacterium]